MSALMGIVVAKLSLHRCRLRADCSVVRQSRFRRGCHPVRHRYGNAPGDPAYDASEAKLAAQPPITVPTIVLHGEADGVGPPAGWEAAARHSTGSYQRRIIPVAGHFLPREAPGAVVAAITESSGGQSVAGALS